MKLTGRIFVPVPRHEGYYWNVLTQTLFSTKKGDEPKELRVVPASRYNEMQAGYNLHKNGVKYYARVNELKTLNREECVALVFPKEHFEEDLFQV